MKPAPAPNCEQDLLTSGLLTQDAESSQVGIDFYIPDRHLTVAKPMKLRTAHPSAIGLIGRNANITLASFGLMMVPQTGMTATDLQMLTGASDLWFGSVYQPTGAEIGGWSYAHASAQPGADAHDRQIHQRMLTAPVAELSREALAILPISKSQMATILGIERPHFYQWLKGQVERPSKAGRLHDLLTALYRAGITHRDPLRTHLLTEPLEPSATTLLDQLAGDLKNPMLISSLVHAAKLNRTISAEAEQRVAKIRAAGHVAPGEDEAQATFDQTMMMTEWDNS